MNPPRVHPEHRPIVTPSNMTPIQAQVYRLQTAEAFRQQVNNRMRTATAPRPYGRCERCGI